MDDEKSGFVVPQANGGTHPAMSSAKASAKAKSQMPEPMKVFAAHIGREFAREQRAMRDAWAACREDLHDEFMELRRTTKAYRQMRDDHADKALAEAVRVALSKLGRDLRAYVEQRIERGMAELVDDLGKGRRKAG